MKKLKLIKIIVFLFIAIIIVLVPLPAADMNVRIHFWEEQGQNCSLYYTTISSPAFSQDKCVTADIDPNRKQVTFRLDASLKNQITGIRLDFPQTSELQSIDKITLSSAGIIQKQYNPCDFFAPEHIVYVNQADYSVVEPHNRVYIASQGTDTHFIFTEALSKEFNEGFSTFRLSRLGIILFVAGCIFSAKKKIFI